MQTPEYLLSRGDDLNRSLIKRQDAQVQLKKFIPICMSDAINFTIAEVSQERLLGNDRRRQNETRVNISQLKFRT